MNDRQPWFRLLLIAALLAALVATARSGQSRSRDQSGVATACELHRPDRPDDVDGIVGLEQCLTINPRDVEVMLDLGTLYEAGGRLDRAEALYQQALLIDPKDGDVHVRLGRLLLQRGDRAAAARAARAALAFQPRSSRALDLLGHTGWDDTK